MDYFVSVRRMFRQEEVVTKLNNPISNLYQLIYCE